MTRYSPTILGIGLPAQISSLYASYMLPHQLNALPIPKHNRLPLLPPRTTTLASQTTTLTLVYPFSVLCTYSKEAYDFSRAGNPLSCCIRASRACRIFLGATDSHGFSLSSSIFSQILLSSDHTPFRSWSSSNTTVTLSSLLDTRPETEEGGGGGGGGEGSNYKYQYTLSQSHQSLSNCSYMITGGFILDSMAGSHMGAGGGGKGGKSPPPQT